MTSEVAVKHGLWGYGKGCRCAQCKEAKSSYIRIRDAGIKDGTWGGKVSLAEKHGTTEGYRIGCRCLPCKESKRRSDRAALLRKNGLPAPRAAAAESRNKYGQSATVHEGCGGLLAEDDYGRVFCLRCEGE